MPEEGTRSLKAGTTGSCESPEEFWEPNSVPQKEQDILTAESSLQALSVYAQKINK